MVRCTSRSPEPSESKRLVPMASISSMKMMAPPRSFIFVDLAPQADETGFAAALAAMPEVQEAHHVTGPHSWLLKLRVRDTASLQRAIATRLKPLPGVLRTETLIALDTAKETAELDLGA